MREASWARATFTGVVAGGLFLCGCKTPLEKDRENANFPALEALRAKMSNLPAIQADAKARPALAASSLRLDGKGGSSLCVHIDAPHDAFGRPASLGTGVFECEQRAAQRPGDGDPTKIASCNAIQYAIAIRTRRLEKATIKDATTFRGASYEYDAHVYELASKTYRGGVPLRAESSTNVKARLGDGADDKLLTDVLNNACANAEKLIAGGGK